MKRTAAKGEFRANIHRGGKSTGIDLSDEEARAALQAAKAVGLDVAGVDLLRSKTGPKILEINSSPGLQGIEQATGVDVAGAVIEYLSSPQGNSSARGFQG